MRRVLQDALSRCPWSTVTMLKMLLDCYSSIHHIERVSCRTTQRKRDRELITLTVASV